MDGETSVKAGLEKISRFKKYIAIGISFNENLQRIVDNFIDGYSNYLRKLPRMLCAALKKIAYVSENGVLKAIWCWNHL